MHMKAYQECVNTVKNTLFGDKFVDECYSTLLII